MIKCGVHSLSREGGEQGGAPATNPGNNGGQGDPFGHGGHDSIAWHGGHAATWNIAQNEHVQDLGPRGMHHFELMWHHG